MLEMMELYTTETILWSLGLTLVAGLATGAGSVIAFFFKRTNTKFLSCALGFSAGMMVYISLVELLAEAHAHLGEVYGSRPGGLATTGFFFGGMLLAMLIDKLIPGGENPHEVRGVEEMDSPKHKDKMLRSSILFALALAIHNIPEGITVSVPMYHATGSRKKAFAYSFLSGLAEPAGALIAWLVLMPFLSEVVMMFTFAAVAGIMVYIAFDELLPLSEEYGEHHIAIAGVIGGMLVMALTLVL